MYFSLPRSIAIKLGSGLSNSLQWDWLLVLAVVVRIPNIPRMAFGICNFDVDPALNYNLPFFDVFALQLCSRRSFILNRGS